MRTKRPLRLLSICDCQVQKRNGAAYGVVEAPPLAESVFHVYNSPEDRTDAYLGPTRVPIVRTRTAFYRTLSEDVCEVGLGFRVAIQLMTLSVLSNFAAPVSRFGLVSNQGFKSPRRPVPQLVPMPSWKSVQVIVLIYLSNLLRETFVVSSHPNWLLLPRYYQLRVCRGLGS